MERSKDRHCNVLTGYRALLVIALFTLMTGLVGQLTSPPVLAAQDDTEPTPVPPTPTPVPPTPTPVPPTPTPVPPTPTATDVQVPMDQTAVAPTLPPTEAPTLPPTEAPTAEPTAERLIDDSLECGALAATLDADRWRFEGACVYTVNSPRSATRIQASVSEATLPDWMVHLHESRDAQTWGEPAFADDDATAVGTSFSFGVRLTAPEAATTSQTATVVIASEILEPESAATGPTASLSVAIPALETGACSAVTASLEGWTLPPATFSEESQTVNGTMTVEVLNPERCSGWVVDIAATDLQYSGSDPNPNPPSIPASNLRIVLPDSATIVLSPEPQQLIVNGGTEESSTYSMPVELQLPGGTSAGTYTTVVTVSARSAP